MNISKELEKLEAIDVDDPCDMLRFLVDEECKRLAKQGVNVYPFVPKRMTFQAARGFVADCKPKSEWLTVRQAASYLGMSESGLRKLVARKGIRFAQNGKGGTIKFKRDWLDYKPAHSAGSLSAWLAQSRP